ncbi:MAG: hypothetical protein M1491_00270 [Deltaproteobacteria bacterium]|nr:hypothetical protein [Deltaproteobacteria bacterium]MCL5277815.1 hypothetical protein [Deltaproteobacteria bacterium]
MVKMKVVKIILVFLIFAFTSNVALASAARANLRSLSKINHTGKKISSKLVLDDPDSNADPKPAFHKTRHRVRSLYIHPIGAVTPAFSIFTDMNYISLIPIKAFQPSSNNLFAIFIPPEPPYNPGSLASTKSKRGAPGQNPGREPVKS